MAAPRKLIAASSLVAKRALAFGTGAGDGELPWDVVGEKLAELLRFLASAAQTLAAQLREHAASLFAALSSLARGALAVALPAAAVVAVLLVVCWCCVAAGRRRQSGPDGEEVEGLGSGDDEDDDGPVVIYRGGCKGAGGILRMHPNKPFVC